MSAWQQHQVEAGFESPGGRLAHALLIERLKHAGKHVVVDIDENGREKESDVKRKHKALEALFSGLLH